MSLKNLKRFLPVILITIPVSYWIYFHFSPQIPSDNRNIAVFSHRLNYDPEAPYALSSLSRLKGHDYVYVDHPGTPVQLIGTGIYALTYPFIEFTQEDFILFHLENHWIFLLLARGFLLLTSVFCMYMLFRYSLPKIDFSDYLVASAVALSFYAFMPNSFVSLVQWSHNSFAFPFGTLLLLITYKLIYRKKPLTWKEFWLLGFSAGVLTSIQIYFATWVIGIIVIVLALAILENWSIWKASMAVFRISLLAFFGFVVATLPIANHYGNFFRWIISIFSHQGIYGSGPAGITSIEAINHNIDFLYSNYPLLVIATIVLLLFIAILLVRNRKSFSDNPKLWAITIGLYSHAIVTFFVILKHPSNNYMVAIAAFWPTLVICGFLALDRSNPIQSRLRITLSLMIVFATIYTLISTTNGHNEYLQQANERITGVNEIIDDYAHKVGKKSDDVVLLTSYRSLESHCQFLWFGNVYADLAFSKEISQLCPSQSYYNIWRKLVLMSDNTELKINDTRLSWDLLILSTALFQRYPPDLTSPSVETGDLHISLNSRLQLDSGAADFLYLDFNYSFSENVMD